MRRCHLLLGPVCPGSLAPDGHLAGLGPLVAQQSCDVLALNLVAEHGDPATASLPNAEADGILRVEEYDNVGVQVEK